MSRADEHVGSSNSSVSSYDLLDSPPSEPFTDFERVSDDESIDKEESARLLHNYILQNLKHEEDNPSFFSPQFSPYYSEGEDDEQSILNTKSLKGKEEMDKQSVNASESTNVNVDVNLNVNEIRDQNENGPESLFESMGSNSIPLTSQSFETSSASFYSENSASHLSTSLSRNETTESVNVSQNILIDPKEEVGLSPTHPISIASNDGNPQTSIAYVQRYDQTVFWIVKKREDEEGEESDMQESAENTEKRLVQRQPQPQDFFELRLNKKQLSSSLFLSLMLFTHAVAFGAGLLFGRSNRIMSRVSTATPRSE